MNSPPWSFWGQYNIWSFCVWTFSGFTLNIKEKREQLLIYQRQPALWIYNVSFLETGKRLQKNAVRGHSDTSWHWFPKQSPFLEDQPSRALSVNLLSLNHQFMLHLGKANRMQPQVFNKRWWPWRAPLKLGKNDWALKDLLWKWGQLWGVPQHQSWPRDCIFP